MAGRSSIEWTDDVWNPIVGCSVVSAGCTNCYAMRQAWRWNGKPDSVYRGLTRERAGKGPTWTGEVRMAPDHTLTAPLRWKKPRRIFVNSMGDLFHEDVPDAWIDQVFAVMALAPQHLFMILTKRPARMRDWFAERWQGTPAQTLHGIQIPPGGPSGRMGQVEAACEPFIDQFGLCDPANEDLWTADEKCKAMQWPWPLPNVWLGVSAEDQATADERIPPLLAAPAAGRFLSAEPLLGPVDLTAIERTGDAVGFMRPLDGRFRTLDYVIAGGESGPNARPMHREWVRQIRDDCEAAGVPFHFKQWGEWVHAGLPGFDFDPYAGTINGRQVQRRKAYGLWFYRAGKAEAGAELDGRTHDALAPLPGAAA